ncbi:ABC-F family ATP-binding cassette domain-containing protein [Phytomonospora endophytica]|uniref:ATPase subunit of ABC transporter with duplicated ATPase domains n=1 Tax=Phytomonospora endophytica TaxID=714109 RepID=A0A841FMD9_9ACTN|nr:ABC-F family ATP-binding cassette domain-containing protein [Phytomonospora endophytica]MBB6034712.1 ATPase subunit of ABC transporter with duplicated ATPase domains [Phytomonospora endophytica]GIG69086.1 ABC transporter [Phytomonospora endophytica]
MTTAQHSIVCTGLTFSWPDGSPVFTGLDFTAGTGRTALIGDNGSGKSTLLKLIAGLLTPTGGHITLAGELAYLPQELPLQLHRTVDDLLGIAGVRAALRAIEGGDADEAHFAAVGDAWDVEERARATLDRLGLPHVELDRPVSTLSGGESMLVGLAGKLLSEPTVLLLDEPTNNLDLSARRNLYRAVAEFSGALLLVSHDRELLDQVDQIAELREGRVRMYGGDFSMYEEAVAGETDVAERALRTAQADLRKQKRELIEAQIKIDRRTSNGRKAQLAGGIPKIVAGGLKRKAEVSAGKLRGSHETEIAEAEAARADAELALRDETVIRLDLPHTRVPNGRTVLEVENLAHAYLPAPVTFEVRGPERIALTGGNGAGKTTLMRLLTGTIEPEGGTFRYNVPGVHYLPQRLEILDDEASALDNVRRYAPELSDHDARTRLAALGFRNNRAQRRSGVRNTRAEQEVRTLSGGERLRVALAAVLSAEPAPQLLMLDEPTNNLDMTSVRQLEQALLSYEGALIVVSHDLPFLRAIGIDRWLRLERGEEPGLTSSVEEP